MPLKASVTAARVFFLLGVFQRKSKTINASHGASKKALGRKKEATFCGVCVALRCGSCERASQSQGEDNNKAAAVALSPFCARGKRKGGKSPKTWERDSFLRLLPATNRYPFCCLRNEPRPRHTKRGRWAFVRRRTAAFRT